MKKVSYILLAMLFLFGSVVMCGATTITTSATGTKFGDTYGYEFVIEDSANPNVFHATLTNTSTSSSLDPLINMFAFNIDAIMGADFNITSLVFDVYGHNEVPADWQFTAGSGGVAFDYVGNERGAPPDHRLHMNQTLTFDFVFSGFGFPTNPFDIWLQADGSDGGGLGGGDPSEDFGQVAAKFQRLGGEVETGGLDGSDLLASNWEGGADPQYVIPEPATMLLLGSGLIGFAVSGKKRFKKRNG